MTKLAQLLDKADPSRFIKFNSTLHDQRVAAILGITLGVTFGICFITGLVSHFMQHPPGWFTVPSQPTNFYRVNQGLHVVTGLAAIPVLLAKLYVVFPKLFEWPPVTGVAHALERASLPLLIGGGLFMVFTGLANISQWYFFDFFFTDAHYAVSFLTTGAMVIHIGSKGSIAKRQVFSSERDSFTNDKPSATGLTRRGFVSGIFGTSAIITLFSVGQSFSPLGRLALLSPRRPGLGPQGLPVNKTALGAGVVAVATASDYLLRVEGNVATPRFFTLSELRSLPQKTSELPITCVEGWSASARWSGVSVPALLAMVGAPANASVRIESMEQGSPYRSSILGKSHAGDTDTLLALDLNGEPLHIDHGFPCRLIAPNRPGVLQTKWVNKVVVL